MPVFIACNIAGTKFRDIEAQVVAARLKKGDPLTLVPEPDNKYDRHAVKVMTDEGIFLGYVPAIFSPEVAGAIAAGEVLNATGGTLPATMVIESAG